MNRTSISSMSLRASWRNRGTFLIKNSTFLSLSFYRGSVTKKGGIKKNKSLLSKGQGVFWKKEGRGGGKVASLVSFSLFLFFFSKFFFVERHSKKLETVVFVVFLKRRKGESENAVWLFFAKLWPRPPSSSFAIRAGGVVEEAARSGGGKEQTEAFFLSQRSIFFF